MAEYDFGRLPISVVRCGDGLVVCLSTFCTETGLPLDVSMDVAVPNARCVRDTAVSLLAHEVDEQLRINGELVCDPHGDRVGGCFECGAGATEPLSERERRVVQSRRSEAAQRVRAEPVTVPAERVARYLAYWAAPDYPGRRFHGDGEAHEVCREQRLLVHETRDLCSAWWLTDEGAAYWRAHGAPLTQDPTGEQPALFGDQP